MATCETTLRSNIRLWGCDVVEASGIGFAWGDRLDRRHTYRSQVNELGDLDDLTLQSLDLTVDDADIDNIDIDDEKWKQVVGFIALITIANDDPSIASSRWLARPANLARPKTWG